MSRAFADINFTPSVKAAQSRYGTRDNNKAYERAKGRQDSLTDVERTHISERDGFFQATVNEAGWPYVQFRGGPAGFVKILDDKTIAFADFRGNLQYLSVGNLGANDRIAMIFIDWATGGRLKVWGRARVTDSAVDPALLASLTMPAYRARVERAIVITVEAFDWNCPQHITPRFTEAEVREMVEPLVAEVESLREKARAAEASKAGRRIGHGPLKLVVTALRTLTPRVRAYELQAPDGSLLPEVSAGAHLHVPVDFSAGTPETRDYSICSDPDDPTRWEIAVLHEEQGKARSAFIRQYLSLGVTLGCSAPENRFRLHSDDRPAVLVAGGIGIAPLKAMAHALWRDQRRFELHYAARSEAEAPYAKALRHDFPGHVRTYWSDQGALARMNLDVVIAQSPAGCVFYVCGPSRMMDPMKAALIRANVEDNRVSFERFDL